MEAKEIFDLANKIVDRYNEIVIEGVKVESREGEFLLTADNVTFSGIAEE